MSSCSCLESMPGCCCCCCCSLAVSNAAIRDGGGCLAGGTVSISDGRRSKTSRGNKHANPAIANRIRLVVRHRIIGIGGEVRGGSRERDCRRMNELEGEGVVVKNSGPPMLWRQCPILKGRIGIFTLPVAMSNPQGKDRDLPTLQRQCPILKRRIGILLLFQRQCPILKRRIGNFTLAAAMSNPQAIVHSLLLLGCCIARNAVSQRRIGARRSWPSLAPRDRPCILGATSSACGWR